MNEFKLISIDKLIPTETTLNKKTIEFYQKTYPLLRNISPPQVIEIDNRYYISDGNNQIYDLYINGKKECYVEFINKDNSNCSESIFKDISSLILDKAKIAYEKNILHIKDLK